MRDNLRASLISGALSAVIMSLFFSLWAGLRIGIIAGAAAGLAFGLAVGVFLAIQERKAKAARSEITQGKSVIMDGGANHLKGAEGVGGWLYLTPDEVIFKSHKFNIQVHQTTMPLDDIEEVRAVRTVGLIPNGLQIGRAHV